MGEDWGTYNKGRPAPKRPKGISYSGGAKKKDGCWLTALVLLGGPVVAIAFAVKEVVS